MRHPEPAAADGTERFVASLSDSLVELSIRRPRRVLALVGLLTVAFAALFVRVDIDTDPENMLPADAPARVVNAELRETFGGAETVVVGLFSPDGAITGDALTSIAVFHDELVAVDGVDERLVVSARTAMGSESAAPLDQSGANDLLARVEADPLLGGNVVSADRDALAVFVPLDDKSDAKPVADAVDELLDGDRVLGSWERQVAGLPLAQEAFGDQMFVQMAVFAPLAGLAIFLLMLAFFRRLAFVGPAMVLALLSVIWTMGLLIGTGNTLHIMSSMIPIFLMPIAILDAIHVISEFFDRARNTAADRAGRADALRAVYRELNGPIAYTTATTTVGFAALALTPIPPVRVFGVFVAIGVVLAWLGTLTVLPALLSVTPARSFAERTTSTDRVDAPADTQGAVPEGRFARLVGALPTGAVRRRTPTIVVTLALAAVAAPAVASLEVNDNPVNWFRSGHEVRVATERLNDALPGTFAANILLDETRPGALLEPATIAGVQTLQRELGVVDVFGAVVANPDRLDLPRVDGHVELAG
ncbi:MAG: MMPL family transporter [Actinomycetota bacterium]